MTNLKTRSIAAAAAIIATIATVGASAPASAATPVSAENNVSTTVAYADLDLSTPGGQATMDRRIHQAAARVCGPLDLANRVFVQACRSRAIAGASVRLTAVQKGAATVQLAAAR